MVALTLPRRSWSIRRSTMTRALRCLSLRRAEMIGSPLLIDHSEAPVPIRLEDHAEDFLVLKTLPSRLRSPLYLAHSPFNTNK